MQLPALHNFLLAAFVVAASGCVSPFGQESGSSRQNQKLTPVELQQQVLARMDACLKQQQETNRRLSLQLEQISGQQEQLEELNQSILAQDEPDKNSRTTPSGNAFQCASPENVSNKLLVGGMEKIWLPELGMTLSARVDTGADTASLDARNIEIFERNGRRWVRFEILDPKTNEVVPLERKLKRTVLILQASTTEPERRPVVKMAVMVGDINQTAEFTLSDRAHLDHQALIGRNILQDVMIVDVSKKYIAPLLKEADVGNSK